MSKVITKGPKVLFVDIETSPLLAYIWGMYGIDSVSVKQVLKHSTILGFAAKWLGDSDKNIMYMDSRKHKSVRHDKRLVKALNKLLDEADIVIGQNSNRFDVPFIKARVSKHKIKPLHSSFRKIDTKLEAKKHWRLPSYSLEYLCEYFGTPFKKLNHKKFPGMELWNACLKRNIEAFDEMERYNKRDVQALESLYNVIKPLINTIDFNVYHDELVNYCSACNHTKFIKKGTVSTNSGRYQRYRCKNCGKETRGKVNLLSKEKRASLRPGVAR